MTAPGAMLLGCPSTVQPQARPSPLVNAPLRGTTYVPAFLWPDHRLILEADSQRFHGNMIARADDATRQLVLGERGLRVIRTTWVEATTQPGRLQRRVEDALRAPVGWMVHA